MKTLLLIFSCIIFLGCSKIEEPTPLEGYYSLESCICGITEIIPFQQQIKLDFDNSVLDVVVFNDQEERSVLFKDGTYNFEVLDTNQIQVLNEESLTFCYQKNQNSLTFSLPCPSSPPSSLADAFSVFNYAKN